LWQAIIYRYFPYLPKIEAEAFKDTPKKLFREEVEKYFNYINEGIKQYNAKNKKNKLITYEEKMLRKLVFSAILGDTTEIKKAYISDGFYNVPFEFYIVAAANGHFESLYKEEILFERKIMACSLAAKHGNLAVLNELLEKIGKDPAFSTYKHLVLEHAAYAGQEHIIKALLSNPLYFHNKDHAADKDHESFIGCAAEMAVYNGHVGVLKMLLQHRNEIYGDKLINNYFGHALMAASAKGNFNCVKLILKYAGKGMDSFYTDEALAFAASSETRALILSHIKKEVVFKNLFWFCIDKFKQNVMLTSFGMRLLNLGIPYCTLHPGDLHLTLYRRKKDLSYLRVAVTLMAMLVGILLVDIPLGVVKLGFFVVQKLKGALASFLFRKNTDEEAYQEEIQKLSKSVTARLAKLPQHFKEALREPLAILDKAQDALFVEGKFVEDKNQPNKLQILLWEEKKLLALSCEKLEKQQKRLISEFAQKAQGKLNKPFK